MALSKEELRNAGTLWPLIAANLPAAITTAQALVTRPPGDLIQSLVTRYEMGERMYHRDFLDWSPEMFDAEIACEIADVFLYVAMKRVMFGDER